MRRLVLAVMLAGCNLYFSPPGVTNPPPPFEAGIDDGGLQACELGQGSGPFECTSPGLACQLGAACECWCTDTGWWFCSPELAGATCPTQPPPPVDAGIDAPPPVSDAGFPDAPTCGVIEAEDLPVPQGWIFETGAVLHGGYALLAPNPGAAPLRLTFTGTSLAIYVEDGPTIGTYDVQVDDSPVVPLDGNTSAITYQDGTIVATGLANVQHTATVTCAAPQCSVDYFAIGCD
jgi:hypothetical protein